MDYLVVGGGISGLTMALELSLQKYSVVLLEKDNRLGGRIREWVDDNLKVSLAAGASRFNDQHVLVKQLLHYFDIPLPKPQPAYATFIDAHMQFPEFKHLENGFVYVSKVTAAAMKESKETLQRISFQKYASTVLRKREVRYMLAACGYSGQLKHMNAWDAVKLFETGIHPDFNYYSNVYPKLLKRLVECLQNNKVELRSGVEVEKFEQLHGIYTATTNRGEKISGQHLVLCLPQQALLYLKGIPSPLRHLLRDSIHPKALCRTYAVYKPKDVWFASLCRKVYVNNDLRQVIPVDAKKGIIMISYTDDQYTEPWRKLQKDQKALKLKVQQLIHETFGLQTALPQEVRVFYWGAGVSYWRPGVRSECISQKVLNPMRNLYICGENYSTNQSWVQGALETCLACMDKITKKCPNNNRYPRVLR